MALQSFLADQLCEAHIVASTKKEFLAHVAAQLAIHPATKMVSQEFLLRELQKREKKTSTGFGNEVAIPHARIKGMTEFVSFILTSKEGIPFGAIDKLPVKLFFVLVGPEERVEDHIKMLALLSRTLCKEGVKDRFIVQTDSAELYRQTEEEIEKHVVAIRGESAHAGDAIKSDEGSHASLILINVYEEEYLQQVLESLLEYGVTGATIIDSTGMGQFLSEAPLFGNFIGAMRQNKYHSKTIIAVADNSGVVGELFNEIERNIGEKRKYEIVSLFAMKLHAVRGSMSAV